MCGNGRTEVTELQVEWGFKQMSVAATCDVLAIIPARGGSRRLPRKNLKPLAGKPLIAYTIEAALMAGLRAVVVSTDDPEIAAEAENRGACVPFIRPAHLASDTATSVDVAIHCVNALDARYEAVMLLQPTSPLRAPEDITQSLQLYLESSPEAVVSVCATHLRPQWVFSLENGFLRAPASDGLECHGPFYVVNGAIYIVSLEALFEQRTFVPRLTIPYIMPRERSVDIDTAIDFRLAESLIRDTGPS